MGTTMHKNINKITSRRVAIQRIILLILPIIFSFVFYLVRYYSFLILELLPPCIFHEKTSLLCPGCGMTRSILALLQGNILICLKANILTTLLIAFCFFVYIELLAFSFGKKFLLLPRNPRFYWIGLSLLILYCILRNIDFFSFLKP